MRYLFLLILAITLFSLAPSLSFAQPGVAPDAPNLLGIYSTPDCEADFIDGVGPFEEITAYLVVTHPFSSNLGPVDYISGFECHIIPSAGLIITSISFPADATDVGTGFNYIVGFSDPVPVVDQASLVMTLDLLYTNASGGPETIKLAAAEPASIPDFMAFLDPRDEGVYPLEPVSGSWEDPVFGINTGPLWSGPRDYHVSPAGNDTTGTGSQELPWATIQHAVEEAAPGDSIVLANGRFFGLGNHDVVIQNKDLFLRSASGDTAACIVDGEQYSGGSGNLISSEGSTLVIENITFRNTSGNLIQPVGMVTLEGCTLESGGLGVLATGFAELILRNCTIRNCGTGVLEDIYLPSLITAEDCLFSDNDTAIHLNQNEFFPNFNRCVFMGNEIGLTGWGAKNHSENVPGEPTEKQVHASFVDCVFRENTYGISAEFWGDFLRCEFTGNTGAAAIFNITSYVTLNSCSIHDNPGDGIYLSGLGLHLIDTEVTGSGGFGVSASVSDYGEIRDCLIAGNDGVGLEMTVPYSGGDSFTICNTTVAHNGTGMYLETYLPPQVTECIIAGNTGEGLQDTGAVYSGCNVFGNGPDDGPDSFSPGVAGNFARDPLFCNAPEGDWTLRANSPCAPSELHELIGSQPVGCQGIPEPVMLGVEDVLDDQGGQVRLTWYRSGEDAPGTTHTVEGYDVFRQIDSTQADASGDPVSRLLGWDYLLRVPARGDQGYQVVVPTLCDSTALGGICWTRYFVSAATTDPLTFFDSSVDSGYSVDNLQPLQPTGLVVQFASDGNELSWESPLDTDVDHYLVFRNVGQDGNGDEAIAQVSETTWTDPLDEGSGFGHQYWVVAVDHAGNQSEPTVWEDAQISNSVDGIPPKRVNLHAAVPNPFNPETMIEYDLPRDARVRLIIYSLDGKLVKSLVNEVRSAGSHEAVWSGRNAQGHAMASGTYIYRLEVGKVCQQRIMTLVK